MTLLLKKATAGSPAIPLESYASFEEWQRRIDIDAELFANRWRFDRAMEALDAGDEWLGWCGLCDGETVFRTPSKASGTNVNFREELICTGCGMCARVRAGLQVMNANRAFDRDVVYITEQASPTFVWLQTRIPNLHGSEFVEDPAALANMHLYYHELGGRGNIRFEDVTRMTFKDASLDAIASFDVLEHVPDYVAALREFARTLKAGGMLVLTAPFISSLPDTIVRARIGDEGRIDHLMPPEYHGDPMSSGGILCFYHFAWDLLATAREAGFSDARMAKPWLPGMGFMDHLWMMVATR